MSIAFPLDVRGSGATWQIIDASGATIGRSYSQQWKAEDRKTALELQSKQKRRTCLCCDTEFMSEGPHNRMCAECRNKTEGMA